MDSDSDTQLGLGICERVIVRPVPDCRRKIRANLCVVRLWRNLDWHPPTVVGVAPDRFAHVIYLYILWLFLVRFIYYALSFSGHMISE